MNTGWLGYFPAILGWNTMYLGNVITRIVSADQLDIVTTFLLYHAEARFIHRRRRLIATATLGMMWWFGWLSGWVAFPVAITLNACYLRFIEYFDCDAYAVSKMKSTYGMTTFLRSTKAYALRQSNIVRPDGSIPGLFWVPSIDERIYHVMMH